MCVHRFACLHVCARVFMHADVCGAAVYVHTGLCTCVCIYVCMFVFAPRTQPVVTSPVLQSFFPPLLLALMFVCNQKWFWGPRTLDCSFKESVCQGEQTDDARERLSEHSSQQSGTADGTRAAVLGAASCLPALDGRGPRCLETSVKGSGNKRCSGLLWRAVASRARQLLSLAWLHAALGFQAAV